MFKSKNYLKIINKYQKNINQFNKVTEEICNLTDNLLLQYNFYLNMKPTVHEQQKYVVSTFIIPAMIGISNKSKDWVLGKVKGPEFGGLNPKYYSNLQKQNKLEVIRVYHFFHIHNMVNHQNFRNLHLVLKFYP